jgi:hypothetical protein
VLYFGNSPRRSLLHVETTYSGAEVWETLAVRDHRTMMHKAMLE